MGGDAQSDVAALGSLDKAAQEVAVTMMLDQARQWLERAKVSTTPAQDVADFKAFISTVAEAAKQKRLSEDIQLDAVEMVRRSDRALGLAIREGQANGSVLTSRDGSGVRDLGPEATKVSTKVFFASTNERVDTYALTDNVTEEEFEVSLSIAKEEGNLSRANVVRTVKEVTTPKQEQVDKWEQIADFAARGFTSSQVGKTFDMSEPYLRKLAMQRGIDFHADRIVTRRIDPLKVLENTVAAIEASAPALDLVTYEDVTPEMAAELLERLAPGIKAIRQLTNALKEIK